MAKKEAYVHAAPSRHDNDIILACEELNFAWRKQQVKQVTQMWNDGVPIDEIAKEMRRDVDEVAILIIDQGRKSKVDSRKRGVWGDVA